MIKRILSLVLIALFPCAGFAAGYLEFDDQGTPYKWDTSSPVTYKLDISDLGPITKAGVDGADDLVAQAMTAWENVDPTLSFVSGGNVGADIQLSNLSSYVNLNGNTCPVQDFVVVYDDTGSIFADLFGSTSSSILGLATPSVLNDNNHKITCGYALLNGAAIPNASADSVAQLKYTLMHELGHGRNLEHTQINADLYLDGGNPNDQYIPLMFPVIPQNLTAALAGGIGGIKLDDQFSLLYLYHSSILGNEGRIKGTITNNQGKGILGANVVCYDKLHSSENVVSWVSDSGLDGSGEYTCGHLPPGDYNVKVQPITIAINQWTQGTPPFIPTEYFNGSNESSDPDVDDLTERTDVTVGIDTVTGINIITNDNGRITSGKKVTGSVQPSNVPSLEYFIYVPRSVKKVTFDLKTGSSADLDLYGKCNTPFSLATSTAGPFYSPGNPNSQAVFAGTSDSGNESVTLTGSSDPKISACSEYHLLIVNYDTASSANYELTATMEGNEPKLRANFDPQESMQNNGETLVSVATFQADDDQFTIGSIKFTDTGIKSITNVSTASLYEDINNNGRVDAADTLLGTSTVNTAGRTFTVPNLNVFIKEGGQKQLLITYQIPTSASAMPITIALIGLILFGLFSKRKKATWIASMLFVGLVLGRCSSEDIHDYNPTVQNTTEITAKASGFGSKFSLQVGKPQSVNDFFN